MNAIDEIFQEYIRMREHGLEVQEALRALKVYVEPLDTDMREYLAQHLRNWESDKKAAPKRPAQPIKSLRKSTPVPAAPEPEEFVWVECRTCGKKNRAKEVFCYNCGEMLQRVQGKFDTNHFMQATDDLFQDEFYGDDSLLVLVGKNVQARIELRPQLHREELVIGRSSDVSGATPDLDLTPAKASEFGVSRMHASIRYDDATSTLQINDLGSSNGTFINGQRLLPTERRALRNGDELKFGRLVVGVKFLHPGHQME